MDNNTLLIMSHEPLVLGSYLIEKEETKTRENKYTEYRNKTRKLVRTRITQERIMKRLSKVDWNIV